MDIETFLKDGVHIPYTISWYDGEFTRTYYLTDYNSIYEMLFLCLKELLQFNPNSKVYVHNFSNFDYLFLIKVLYENFSVKPYFRDNKVINIVYQNKNNDKSKIEIFDSFLILPASLITLALKYKIQSQKGYLLKEIEANNLGQFNLKFNKTKNNEKYKNFIWYTYFLQRSNIWGFTIKIVTLLKLIKNLKLSFRLFCFFNLIIKSAINNKVKLLYFYKILFKYKNLFSIWKLIINLFSF